LTWRTGYEDTSFTAKLQAKYTDLIVFNKWESCDERRFDECLDRLGDMEGVDVAWVKSDKGSVPADLVFGIDGGLARSLGEKANESSHAHDHKHDHDHGEKGHQSEVEVLSITLTSAAPTAYISVPKLLTLLRSAPKDEVYRIKAVLSASSPVPGSDTDLASHRAEGDSKRYILNWAFGRWTSTPMKESVGEHASSNGVALRMTMILARYESTKWTKKIQAGAFVQLEGDDTGELQVEKIA